MLFGAQIQVSLDFVVQLAIEAASVEDGNEPR